MKKFLIFIISTTFLLFSCSQISRPETKTETQNFSFSLNSEFIEAITAKCRTIEGVQNDEQKIKICLEFEFICDLSGSHCTKQEDEFTLGELKNNEVSFEIKDIPLDEKFRVKIQVYIFDDELIYEGVTEEQTLKLSDDNIIEEITVQVIEQKVSDYVLYRKDNALFYFGVFKPQEVLSVTKNDFQHTIETDYDDDNNEISFNVYTYFLDSEFDAQGNLWVIKQDEAQIDELIFCLYKRINNEYIKVPIEEEPLLFCIDDKTNTLVTMYEKQKQLYFNTYTINENSTNQTDIFTNTFEEIYTPTKTINANSISANLESYKIKCIESYNDVLYISYIHTEINNYENVYTQEIFIYQYRDENPSSINCQYSVLPLSQLFIKDMTTIQDNLYVLFDYNETEVARFSKPNFTSKGFSAYSYGCLTKFSIDSTTGSITNPIHTGLVPEQGNLYKANEKFVTFQQQCIQTDYIEEDYITIYNDLFTDESLTQKALYTTKLTSLIPASIETKQFFGPKKIVAVKPKKLVIQDNGMFVYSEDDNWFYKPVNRLVTVDLETFAITDVQNLNVDFDVVYASGLPSMCTSVENLYYKDSEGNACVYTGDVSLYIKFSNPN